MKLNLTRNTKTTLMAIVAIILCPIVYFSPLYTGNPKFIYSSDFGISDMIHTSISYKYLLWNDLHENKFSVWSKQLDMGFPVFAESQIGSLYFPNIILYKYLPFITAYNTSIVLAVIVFALGAFFWLKTLSIRTGISMVASLSLAFSGITVMHLTRIMHLQSLSMIPWIVLSVHQLTSCGRRIYISVVAILISQQLFTGFPQGAVITLTLTACYVGWQTIMKKE